MIYINYIYNISRFRSTCVLCAVETEIHGRLLISLYLYTNNISLKLMIKTVYIHIYIHCVHVDTYLDTAPAHMHIYIQVRAGDFTSLASTKFILLYVFLLIFLLFYIWSFFLSFFFLLRQHDFLFHIWFLCKKNAIVLF